MIATRPAETPAEEELLVHIATRATVILPRPLTVAAVGRLVQERLERAPEPAFSQACHTATGGTPLLLHELLREPRYSGATRSHAGSRCWPA